VLHVIHLVVIHLVVMHLVVIHLVVVHLVVIRWGAVMHDIEYDSEELYI
jgi:hypothetical protein